MTCVDLFYFNVAGGRGAVAIALLSWKVRLVNLVDFPNSGQCQASRLFHPASRDRLHRFAAVAQLGNKIPVIQ